MTVTPLNRKHTGVVIVDVQERLMSAMVHRERVVKNIIYLIHLSRLFNLPIILTEQYPKWLGPTLQEITKNLRVYEPIKKLDFNCCAVEFFNERLKLTGIEYIVLTGVETHICILQTCLSLLESGYKVHVPQDAVDSRTDENWLIGVELMRNAGAVITSTETIIFQILKKADTKEFKEMLKIIK